MKPITKQKTFYHTQGTSDRIKKWVEQEKVIVLSAVTSTYSKKSHVYQTIITYKEKE